DPSDGEAPPLPSRAEAIVSYSPSVPQPRPGGMKPRVADRAKTLARPTLSVPVAPYARVAGLPIAASGSRATAPNLPVKVSQAPRAAAGPLLSCSTHIGPYREPGPRDDSPSPSRAADFSRRTGQSGRARFRRRW